jgi:hypothetical protein
VNKRNFIAAFFAGYIASAIYRGMPIPSMIAGLIFFAVLGWFLNIAMGILEGRVVTPGSVLDQREEMRRAARSLRNRPGRMNTDLTGIKPRNKGSVGKHLRWVKK